MCAHEGPLQIKLKGEERATIKVWAVRAAAERDCQKMNEPAVPGRGNLGLGKYPVQVSGGAVHEAGR